MIVSSVCRVHLQHEQGDRWLTLALALRIGAEKGRFLDYSEHFLCELQGVDQLSSIYALRNWESGILSGAFFAFRKQKKGPVPLLLSELRGRLRSEEMEVLALASSIAVSQLLGGVTSDWQIPGWAANAEVLTEAATSPS